MEKDERQVWVVEHSLKGSDEWFTWDGRSLPTKEMSIERCDELRKTVTDRLKFRAVRYTPAEEVEQ